MRRKLKNKRKIVPDLKYGSPEVSKLINYIMERGKKSIATKIVYNAFDDIKSETKLEPVEVFQEALRNTSPSVEVLSKSVGGANYQVPRDVRLD